MFNFDQLLKLNFWFAKSPGPAGVYFTRLSFVFGLLFLIALVIYLFIAKVKRKDFNPVKAKLWRKVYICFFTISIIGGALIFFRYEQIPFLSLRFLMLTLLVGFLVWVGFIIFYYLRGFKRELLEYQEEERKKKYLR
ncbi:hypothetical protein E3J85_02380 [Patescibacteria group bacterium]|nr:MAG: hypothetical protein E3J85_02380 [Patescibacteria group bacterium]